MSLDRSKINAPGETGSITGDQYDDNCDQLKLLIDSLKEKVERLKALESNLGVIESEADTLTRSINSLRGKLSEQFLFDYDIAFFWYPSYLPVNALGRTDFYSNTDYIASKKVVQEVDETIVLSSHSSGSNVSGIEFGAYLTLPELNSSELFIFNTNKLANLTPGEQVYFFAEERSNYLSSLSQTGVVVECLNAEGDFVIRCYGRCYYTGNYSQPRAEVMTEYFFNFSSLNDWNYISTHRTVKDNTFQIEITLNGEKSASAPSQAEPAIGENFCILRSARSELLLESKEWLKPACYLLFNFNLSQRQMNDYFNRFIKEHGIEL